jgi:hypothetical protein
MDRVDHRLGVLIQEGDKLVGRRGLGNAGEVVLSRLAPFATQRTRSIN